MKKTLLIIIIISLAGLAGSAFYLMQNPSKKENLEKKIEPNYQDFLKSAMEYYEDAESALIYKDYKKVEKLLEKSKNYAKQIAPSSDLYKEAKDLLSQIEEKIEKVNLEKKEE
jgi:phage shock protein A